VLYVIAFENCYIRLVTRISSSSVSTSSSYTFPLSYKRLACLPEVLTKTLKYRPFPHRRRFPYGNIVNRRLCDRGGESCTTDCLSQHLSRSFREFPGPLPALHPLLADMVPCVCSFQTETYVDDLLLAVLVNITRVKKFSKRLRLDLKQWIETIPLIRYFGCRGKLALIASGIWYEGDFESIEPASVSRKVKPRQEASTDEFFIVGLFCLVDLVDIATTRSGGLRQNESFDSCAKAGERRVVSGDNTVLGICKPCSCKLPRGRVVPNVCRRLNWRGIHEMYCYVEK
jgi:hypothetical protein